MTPHPSASPPATGWFRALTHLLQAPKQRQEDEHATVPPHTYAAIHQNLQAYSIPNTGNNDTKLHDPTGDGYPKEDSSCVSSSLPTLPSLPSSSSSIMVAQFRRDEIITTHENLPLTAPPPDLHRRHEYDSKPPLFEYHNVSGIVTDHALLDPTENDLTDFHSDNHDMDDDFNHVYHRDVVPDKQNAPAHRKKIPVLATDVEDAREWIAAQAFQLQGCNKQDISNALAKIPVHQNRYMLKQVIHPHACRAIWQDEQTDHDHNDPDGLWLQALTHLVRECQLLKAYSHDHTNLVTLRGYPRGDYETVFLQEASTAPPQWDSYFLLTDRISETLAQRIHRWKFHPQDDNHQSNDTTTSTTSTDHHAKGIIPGVLTHVFRPPPPRRKRPPPNHNNHTNAAATVVVSTAPVDATSLEFRTKLVYAQNLASVLAFLHSKQIILRNLHPESIGFLASDDTLQLLDVGQAIQIRRVEEDNDNKADATPLSPVALLQQQHEHALFRMTPGHVFRYMAPELLTTLHPKPCTVSQGHSYNSQQQQQQPPQPNNRGYNCTVDSYSWAMICFELLTLSQPFATLKPAQHLRTVCMATDSSKSPRPHTQVYQFPPTLERLLQAAWHQDATVRPSMHDINQGLLDLLSLPA